MPAPSTDATPPATAAAPTTVEFPVGWSVESRLRLADSLFNNSSVGICVTDTAEHIVDVNPALCQLTGFGRQALLGKTPRVFSSQLHDKAFFGHIKQALAANGQWQGEVWNRHRNGELYAIRLDIAAVYDQQQTITHYVGIMVDITQRKLQMQALEKSAHFDTLTGLPNRLLFSDRLHQALAQADRTGTMLAICYLDLDSFKEINDLHGHPAGDTVLREVASRMAAAIRTGDTVARLGGDEFIVLLWGLEQQMECHHMLDRLLQAVRRPIPLAQGSVLPALSIGVALYPVDAAAPDVLLALADAAMYRSKTAGGNRITYHEE